MKTSNQTASKTKHPDIQVKSKTVNQTKRSLISPVPDNKTFIVDNN